MSNPVQLIPAKVRLTIYLVVFLIALAMTAASNYFTTLEQPVPDIIRGISGGVLPPIAAVFSAVAASNTTDNSDQGPVTNLYVAEHRSEDGRISVLAAVAFALLAAAVVSLILGAHPVLVFVLFVVGLLVAWAAWSRRVHANATHLDHGRWHHVAVAFDGDKKTTYVDGKPSTILDRDWH